jgi:ubiquinone/menaquinone biosynthesis C-methylase UbiE
MDDDLRRQRSAFSSVAGAYDRARPTYPPEAVEWLAGRAPQRVLELGAGTGKLTESLVARRHTVTATDPSAPMLQRLVEHLDVPVAQCAAERLPFRAGSFDLVVVAQAFHWFDLEPALTEIARVLRVGGSLSLVWNYRDERVPWVRRLSAVIGAEPHAGDVDEMLAVTTDFAPPERTSFRFWQELDGPGLVDMVASRSYVAVLPDAEREPLLDRVRDLYDSYGRGPHGMRLPYLTECYRTRLSRSSYGG